MAWLRSAQPETYPRAKRLSSIMDQRVDNERRIEPSPSISPASRGKAERQGSWRDTLRQRRGMIVAIAAGVALLGLAIALWWLHASHYVSTDDAFIDARTVQISAQVSAAIVDVPVTDNELVEAGAVLARLDDRDFVAQLDQAKAQVDQAEASIDNVTAQLAAQQARIDQAKKQVVQAQAALTFAQQQADRYQQLAAKHSSGTVEQAQQYSSNLLQSQASFAAAQANAIAAEKQIAVLEAQRKLYQAPNWRRRTPARSRPTPICRAPSSPLRVAGRVTHSDRRQGRLCRQSGRR